MSERWYDEALYTRWQDKGYAQRFRIERVLFEDKSQHQDVVVFETPLFGRVLAIDGIVQTTEKDEFAYHEMMAHVPILAHQAAGGDVKKVLIVGGGDGGILREVLKHPSVALCTLVDIDDMVVEISKKYLPTLSAGAFDDPRARVVIADGCAFVRETTERYEVVIVDSTDPVGPGSVLFSEAFYADCRRAMSPGGVIVTQSGVPFAQPDEFVATRNRLRAVFRDAGIYLASVPSYACGVMALGWASDDPAKRAVGDAALDARFREAGLETRYYTPAVHTAAFQHPAWIADALK